MNYGIKVFESKLLSSVSQVFFKKKKSDQYSFIQYCMNFGNYVIVLKLSQGFLMWCSWHQNVHGQLYDQRYMCACKKISNQPVNFKRCVVKLSFCLKCYACSHCQRAMISRGSTFHQTRARAEKALVEAKQTFWGLGPTRRCWSVERKALQSTYRERWSPRYGGRWPHMALKVKTIVLNWTRYSISSQSNWCVTS